MPNRQTGCRHMTSTVLWKIQCVEECAAQTERVSSLVLQCVMSDMAAELISLSYLCCWLLPAEKVTEGESRQWTQQWNSTEIMPPLFHLFTPSSSPLHTHTDFKHSPPSQCHPVLLLHRYIMAAPLFTLSSSSSLIFKCAVNTAYEPPPTCKHFNSCNWQHTWEPNPYPLIAQHHINPSVHSSSHQSHSFHLCVKL